jgi:hypothetical protein
VGGCSLQHAYSILASTNVAGPYAPESTFQTTLLGTEEVPANRSTAKGFGSVVLSADQSRITVNEFRGLTAPATAGHIHGPAGPALTPVVFPFRRARGNLRFDSEHRLRSRRHKSVTRQRFALHEHSQHKFSWRRNCANNRRSVHRPIFCNHQWRLRYPKPRAARSITA